MKLWVIKKGDVRLSDYFDDPIAAQRSFAYWKNNHRWVKDSNEEVLIHELEVSTVKSYVGASLPKYVYILEYNGKRYAVKSKTEFDAKAKVLHKFLSSRDREAFKHWDKEEQLKVTFIEEKEISE